MKKYSRQNFTLIELLAAMAVFSILLVVSLRLFSGAQQMWLRSEQKTDTFASARTAMEFLASRMQTLTYVEDSLYVNQYPFEMNEEYIWFVSNVAMGDGNHSRHFVKFRLVDPDGSSEHAGKLQMIKYTGQNAKSKNFFGQLFPSYNETARRNRKIKSVDEAVDHLNNVFEKFDENDFEDHPTVDGVETRAVAVDICENVIGLKFTRYVALEDPSEPNNASKNKLDETAKTGKTNAAPYLVEIELKMLDSRESFLKWRENKEDADKRNDIFLEHGYTFRRAVLLGKKGSE